MDRRELTKDIAFTVVSSSIGILGLFLVNDIIIPSTSGLSKGCTAEPRSYHIGGSNVYLDYVGGLAPTVIFSALATLVLWKGFISKKAYFGGFIVVTAANIVSLMSNISFGFNPSISYLSTTGIEVRPAWLGAFAALVLLSIFVYTHRKGVIKLHKQSLFRLSLIGSTYASLCALIVDIFFALLLASIGISLDYNCIGGAGWGDGVLISGVFFTFAMMTIYGLSNTLLILLQLRKDLVKDSATSYQNST